MTNYITIDQSKIRKCRKVGRKLIKKQKIPKF
jgi:hypothetical protein